MKKKWIVGVAVGTVIVVFLFVLGWFTSHPILSCSIEVPEKYLDAIDAQAKGLYSNRVPLVPIYVSVDDYIGKRVYYTIYYFPFGTVGMSYHEEDGYGMEKSLTGL